MKLLSKILMTMAFTAALSIAAMAQKGGDDQKKPPPKEKPPVVNPQPKPPPKETPKPQKPRNAQYEALVARIISDLEIA